MNIGIIGAGNVGTGLAKHLVPQGHRVTLSFGRDPAKLAAAAPVVGATSGSVAEAVRAAEVVVLATPWSVTSEALRQVGPVPGKKILWDCTNALKPDMSGLALGTTTSAGEEVARLTPWARVVKAIPPFAELMHAGSVAVAGRPVGVFVASDDTDAKRVVTGLVRELGAEPTDAGPLANARYIEPAAFLLVQLAYVQGLGPRIGLTLLH